MVEGDAERSEDAGKAEEVDVEKLKDLEKSKAAKQKRDANVWQGRVKKDGQDRSHIPPISKKLLLLRVAQLGLAVIFLILSAFSAFTLNAANVSRRVEIQVPIRTMLMSVISRPPVLVRPP